MPTPLNFNGNDDNALEALVIDAGIAFSYAGNTHTAIDALADLTAVDLSGLQGNDRWMLEQLAAAMTAGQSFAYRWNESAEEIAVFGPTRPALSNNDQTATITVAGGLAVTAVAYMALVDGAATQTAAHYFPTNAGVRAFEALVDIDTLSGAATGFVGAGVNISAKDFVTIATINVHAAPDGTFEVYVSTAAAPAYAYSATGLVTPPGRFSVVINGDAGTLEVRADGVPLVLSNDAMAAYAEAGVYFSGIEALDVAAENAGKTAAITLVSDPALWVDSYAPGTLSIAE